MTSKSDDGETEQQPAEQETEQTNIPHQTLVNDQEAQRLEGHTEVEEEEKEEDERLQPFPQNKADGDYEDVVQLGAQLNEQQGRRPSRDGKDQSTVASEQSDTELALDSPLRAPQQPNNIVRVNSPSIDDTASIPDDTPSIRGSILSSPRSESPVQSPISRKHATPPRRPFDLRFQSRLSSSTLISPRSSSPAFLNTHSRQSSVASQGFVSVSEADDVEAPWEVIRWHRLTKTTSQIFSEAARRNFGNPTCLNVSDQVIIGTSRGLILIFDHHQNHKAIIGSGTSAIEAGAITAMAISADHTTVAAGHATGHIYTWEINRFAKPFLHVPPIARDQPQAKGAEGHIAGSTVLHIGFLGFRRTALVSADDRGMAFSHLASRGTGALGRSIHSTRILGRYPELVVRSTKPSKKSSVLAFSPLPLGNIEQSTDSLGLVAMLTPYLLVIVSTTPIAQTQHKAARPRDLAAHSAMTAALAWFPAIKLKDADSAISKPKLAYAWSNMLTILEIREIELETSDEKEQPPELQFVPRNKFKAEEAIVAVQWLSRSVIAVLTITQQLLIIEDGTMTMTDAFDLLPKDLYHADVYSHQLQAVIENLDEEDTSMHGVVADAFHMSFRAYKGRLFLLGHKNIWWGSLTNWADRLLAMMDAGDFIGAIRLATGYFVGVGEKLTIGLPESDETRHELVREKLLEMISASLKYVFGKNELAGVVTLDQSKIADLAVASVSACFAINDRDFLFDEVFSWYEEHGKGALFIDVLEPHILEGKIQSLPPTALKILVDHFKTTHSLSKLEEIICLLDPTMMDIDQVTTLCKDNELYDAYIYVWNTALMDFVDPLRELLAILLQKPTMNGHGKGGHNLVDVAQKFFAYMTFVLTGRVYPTGLSMEDSIATAAKLQVYDYLFSGRDSAGSISEVHVGAEVHAISSFPRLRAILEYDTSSLMGVMNEAFEDEFLNTSLDNDADTTLHKSDGNKLYDRQFLLQILIGVMSTGFEPSDTIYLDIFVARNLPKYPQYILLKGSVLDGILMRLCQVDEDDLRDDAQLSVEYLLSVYQPSNPLSLVPILRSARYYRVLKSIFRQEQQYPDLVDACFLDEDNQEAVFDVIQECLRQPSNLNEGQRTEVVEVVKDHSLDLTTIDTKRAAILIDTLLPNAHSIFVEAQVSNPGQQFCYLRTLIEPDQANNARSRHITIEMSGLYVRLMCRYDASHVVTYIKNAREEDLRLDTILSTMESSGVIDAAVILLTRQGQVRESMERLLKHLGSLKAALKGILETAADAPDEIGTNEAVQDLLESIDHYSGVGIWICQGQNVSNQRPRAAAKSPRRTPSMPVLTSEEQLWLELLVAIVSISQDTTRSSILGSTVLSDVVETSIRTTVQKAFTALLTTTTVAKGRSGGSIDYTFLRILRVFLTTAAEASPSLSALRSVISSIFSAYSYEKSLLAISSTMLDKDLFVHVDEVSKLRQLGWRPRGQVCEICKRRVWGPGTGLPVWKAWEAREERRKAQRSSGPFATEELDMIRGKGKEAATPIETASADQSFETNSDIPSGPLIVFSCRHIYHRACLTQGQSEDGQASEETPTQEMQFNCPACH